mgnify:CR=1 FL=1|tara:strand:- start:300 stop:746 length:447 start_codon:yes stop_codon:yes gene_type:complete
MGEELTLFSKIIQGEVPCSLVSKGDDWISFLDIFPRNEGHTLVVPHQPATHLSMLDSKQLSSLWEGVVKTQKILSEHFDTTDFTIGINDGVFAGQEIPHVHVHLIPRKKNDGGGVPIIFPNTKASKDPDFVALNNLSKALQKIDEKLT